jgi:hypothetical protein
VADDPWADEAKVRARRNLTIAGLLLAFIVVVYLVTIFRIGANMGAAP